MQENPKYSFNDDDDDEHKTYEGDVYYIEGGENSVVESIKETAIGLQHSGCAVCGNPCSQKCSRCKAIKYW